MPKATAHLTSKNRLVLPRAVRRQLGVGPGDTITFDYGPDGMRIEKAVAADIVLATFDEWSSAADDEAYRDL